MNPRKKQFLPFPLPPSPFPLPPSLGLDIGGVSSKAADGQGRALTQSFELWRAPDRLVEHLQRIGSAFPSAKHLAVTMTAELCDCFDTKAEGVRHVLEAVEQAFCDSEKILVWQNTGRFVDPVTAREDAWATAAANWLALATFSVRWIHQAPTLLIDIGSTTTDIIPITGGRPVPVGRTDPDRLASGELVYQGVERTPICAVAREVMHAGRRHRTMAEFFATMLDVYLLLEDLPEEPSETVTADSGPKTRSAALDRLARMIGSDRTRFSMTDARSMARQIATAQLQQLAVAACEVIENSLGGRVEQLVLSGSGEFIARRLAQGCEPLRGAKILSLSDTLGPELSRAACAYAVLVLSQEG